MRKTVDLILHIVLALQYRKDSIEHLNEMMKQASVDMESVDQSPDRRSEFRNDKSELTALIEGVTKVRYKTNFFNHVYTLSLLTLSTSNFVPKLEEVSQMQQEFITSPTSNDLHKQLDNLNEQIDSISHTSTNAKVSSPKSGSKNNSLNDSKIDMEVLSERKTRIQRPSARTIMNSLPKPKANESARKLFFYKQPTSKEKEKTTTPNPNDSETPSLYNNSEIKQPQHAKKHEIQFTSSTKKLTMIPEGSFNTPQIKRSNQIESIRDKLRDLKDNSYEPKPVSGMGSTPMNPNQ